MTGPANTAQWAARYIERFGMKLVPLRGKVPIGEAWNADENLIGTVKGAHGHWSRNPHDNVGVCLGPSALVSLDADHYDGARIVLADEGIDLDALIATTPTIIGRAPRLEFKAPPNVKLSRKAFAWPPQVEGGKPLTVLEMRAGRVQDVLPPSIHPEKQSPYIWRTPPTGGFPMLPDSLLRLWLDFDAFKHRARNLCPWAEREPEPTPQPRRSPRPLAGPSVIAAFNEAHDPITILESHGYRRAGKRRWMSPNGHNMAGVLLLRCGKVLNYHSSDSQLGTDHAHDSFDLYRILDHGGDFRRAVKAAAQALGMERHG